MITITAYDWVPDFAKGLVRDLRVRWALEEAGLEYRVRLVTHEEKLPPSYRALQPFSQVPAYQDCCISAARARHYFRPIKPVKLARRPGCSRR